MDATGGENELQRQARALGDPTRYRLFRAIADAGEPVPVSRLVDAVHLHHTVVRQHLAALRDAGLLVESTERSNRRGRPRLVYRSSVHGAVRWAGPEPYEQLSLMLLELLRSGQTPREVGREAGRVAATRVPRGGDAVVEVVRELTRLGFDPSRDVTPTGTRVVLGHCPMADAAARSPQLVCELHHGIVEGMADALGRATVSEFSPGEPHTGGCRLTLTGTDGSSRAALREDVKP